MTSNGCFFVCISCRGQECQTVWKSFKSWRDQPQRYLKYPNDIYNICAMYITLNCYLYLMNYLELWHDISGAFQPIFIWPYYIALNSYESYSAFHQAISNHVFVNWHCILLYCTISFIFLVIVYIHCIPYPLYFVIYYCHAGTTSTNYTWCFGYVNPICMLPFHSIRNTVHVPGGLVGSGYRIWRAGQGLQRSHCSDCLASISH